MSESRYTDHTDSAGISLGFLIADLGHSVKVQTEN